MRRNKHGRNGTLMGLIAAALVVTSIPMVFAGGSEGGPVYGPAGVLELELGRTDSFTWGSFTDDIRTRRNDCTVVDLSGGDELVTLGSVGGVLGFVKDGLGVRGPSDGSGATCGQINAPGESLSIKLSGALAGYLMDSVDLDLELKHGGEALITFNREGSQVAAAIFDPDGPSDDGPDSNDGDNYRFTFGPAEGVVFDEVVITATSGEISLEGGADGTDNGSLNPSANSSQFGIVREYDGVFTCGDVASAFESGVTGAFTLLSIDDEGTPVVCGSKFYDIEADASNGEFLFAPADAAGGGTAVFSGVLTSLGQPLAVDPVTGLQIILLEYDPTGGTSFQPMFACEEPPNRYPGTNGPDDLGDFDNLDAMLRAGETYCFYDVDVDVSYEGTDLVGDETWWVIGEDDPNFSFK